MRRIGKITSKGRLGADRPARSRWRPETYLPLWNFYPGSADGCHATRLKRLGRPYAQERPKAASRTMWWPSWYKAIIFRACLTMSADRFRKRGIISYRRAIERTPPSLLRVRGERGARAAKDDGAPVILRGASFAGHLRMMGRCSSRVNGAPVSYVNSATVESGCGRIGHRTATAVWSGLAERRWQRGFAEI